MIVSTDRITRTPRWLHASLVLVALSLMPIGVTYAQRDAGDRIKAGLQRLGISDEQVAKIKEHLAGMGLTDTQLKQALGGMLRVAHTIKSEGGDFELDPRLESYLADEVGLTDEQIDAVVGLGRRIAHGQKKERAPNLQGYLERIKPHLEKSGFSEEQIAKVLQAMHRLVPEVQSEGKEFELNPRMEGYLVNEVGLTDEQIELVVGLAQRFALGMKKKHSADFDVERIKGHLKENGISDVQIEKTVGALRRVIHEVQSEGKEFELNPRLEGYLVDEVGLTDEQIELVVGLAKRIAHGNKKKQDSGFDVDRIKSHLKEQGLNDVQVEQTVTALHKIIKEIFSEGADFELNPRTEDYLAKEVGFTDEEIDLVVLLAQRIAHGMKEKKQGAGIQGYLKRIQPRLEE
ncbi:MAG: hypothetical protein V3T77_11345, partial [Planctomycetota bacterium]